MEYPANHKKLLEHWPLLLIGVFVVVSLSVPLTKKLNGQVQLRNPDIFLTSSSSFRLSPQKHDSLGMFPDSSFELQSKERLYAEQIYANLKFTPNHTYSATPSENGWEIRFEKPFEPNQIVRASLSTAQNVTASTSNKIFHWAYQVKSAPAVISTSPHNQEINVQPDSRIIIRLSHDNFFESAKNFSITPETNGVFAHRGPNLVFDPAEPLLPFTDYAITLSRGLPFNKSQDKLESDYAFTFKTGATPTSTSWHIPKDKQLAGQFQTPGYSENTIYQQADGGLSHTKNGKSDLALTSRLALTTNLEKFDKIALGNYLLSIFEAPTTDDADFTLAITGQIGLGQPLLNRLDSWINYRHSFSDTEKLYILLAMQRLGAEEWRKDFQKLLDIKKLPGSEKQLLQFLK